LKLAPTKKDSTMADEWPPLEDRFRTIVAVGELTHLSIIPKAGKGGIVWSASVSPSKWGSFFATDADPVKAIHLALDQIKIRKSKPRKGPYDVH
jgi:hypothetical protein